jgi:hypothetical protein
MACARARVYIVRFGAAPFALLASKLLGATRGATIDRLEPGRRYWFSVDAVGEGGVTRGQTKNEG